MQTIFLPLIIGVFLRGREGQRYNGRLIDLEEKLKTQLRIPALVRQLRRGEPHPIQQRRKQEALEKASHVPQLGAEVGEVEHPYVSVGGGNGRLIRRKIVINRTPSCFFPIKFPQDSSCVGCTTLFWGFSQPGTLCVSRSALFHHIS